jgi:GT2 family glycosyltransferase
MPTISVVTVTFNSEAFIRACLQSTAEQADESLAVEHVIVDNASADASVAIVRAEFPGVVLLENAENRGYTAANNQGAAVAGGDYVVFLNPDTIVPPGTFRTMVGVMERHPDIGMVAPRLVDEHGRLSADMGDRAPSFWTLINTFWLLNRLIPGLPGVQRVRDVSGLADCDWACGACLMVRRELVERFSWGTFGVGDDFAYCNQIREAGWRVALTGDAQVIHFAGRSWKVASVRTLKGPPSEYARYLSSRRGRIHATLAIAAMRGGLRVRSAIHGLLYRMSRDPERLYKANKTRQFLGHDEYAVFRDDAFRTPTSYPG